MFTREPLSSYPELLFQAQPVVGSSGVVKPLQMALQGAHIQLCVSIQIVLQQSLVDEGVLHLRRKPRRWAGRSSSFSLPDYFLQFFSSIRHRRGCFPASSLVSASWAVSPRYRGSMRVNTYICLDKLTALFPYSAHRAEDIHPLLHVHHVDHAVNDNERPGPAHPGTVETRSRRRHEAFAVTKCGGEMCRTARCIHIAQTVTPCSVSPMCLLCVFSVSSLS